MYFFFFKQKTAYEMRISDWSSDVCSSDLNHHRYKLGAGQDVSHGVSVLEWCVTLQFPAHALIETNARHSSGRAFVPQSGGGPRRRRLQQHFETQRLRSEERSVGKECGSTARHRGPPYQ